MMTENPKITIIDYQLGNLFSVNQACETVGMQVKISALREDVLKADGLILPGVGAFNEAMNNLKHLGLADAIVDKVKGGTPIFGICLGQQLLFTESEEFGTGKGLDLIPGIIKRFPERLNDRKIKVPHIAWNKIVEQKQSWTDTPLKDLQQGEFMYFIHSYYTQPENDSCMLTQTNYDGIEFCSAVAEKNIFATQFHPEKSGEKGISIYKNWAKKYNFIP
jgi:glutamine amidotransferase